MSSTLLKLSEALKRRPGFVNEAQAAHEQMLKTGKGYAAGEAHDYLKARIAGSRPERPKAKPWQD